MNQTAQALFLTFKRIRLNDMNATPTSSATSGATSGPPFTPPFPAAAHILASGESPGVWLSQMADGDGYAWDAHTNAHLQPAVLDEWARTHLNGDAVRANAQRQRTRALPRPSHAEFVQTLREQLRSSSEAMPSDPLATSLRTSQSAQLSPLAPVRSTAVRHAANEGRWKVVAGVASVAAVGAMAFSLVNWQRAAGPQLASAAPFGQAAQRASASNVPNTSDGASNGVRLGDRSVAQAVLVGGEPGVMIRDARLMELMAQHKQLGGNALQGPTGFLRNATFNNQACPTSADGFC